jgi:hypothetical protein
MKRDKMQNFKKIKSRQKQEKIRKNEKKNMHMSKHKRVAGRRGLFLVGEGIWLSDQSISSLVVFPARIVQSLASAR